MALIKCPECNKEISDQAKWCVHCGYPLEQDTIAGIQKLLSVRDVRRIFGCSTKVVNDLLQNPDFPKIQIGKDYYVPKDKFVQWIEENVGKSK